jgi:hypothetical protein
VRGARIKLDGSFDPEPMALPQLQAMLGSKHGVKLELSANVPSALSNEQIAFLTLSTAGKLPDAEATALRKWIDAGGTLWIDAAGGDTDAAMQVDALLLRLGLTMDKLESLDGKPVLTGKGLHGGYDNTSLAYRPYTEGERPPVRVAMLNNRPAVYVTRGDICSGLAGINDAQITGLSVTSARQLVANSILALPALPSAKAPTSQPAKVTKK